MSSIVNTLYYLSQLWWALPIVTILGGLLATLVVYFNYTILRSFLLRKHLFLPCALLDSAYLPLLITIWAGVLRIIDKTTHIPLTVFFNTLDMDAMHRIGLLLLAIWFVIRFFNLVKEKFIAISLASERESNRQIANLGVGILYCLLTLLFVLATLHILDIAMPYTSINNIGTSLIIAIFAILLLYLSHVILSEYVRFCTEKEYFWARIVLMAVRTPLILLIISISAIRILKIFRPADYLSLTFGLDYREIALFCLFGMLYRTASFLETQLLLSALTKGYPNRAVVQTTSKIGRVFIIFIGLTIFFAKVYASIQQILAIFGGSAVVIGIVGKDIFANYLSSLIIYFDGKFKVGDWIYSVDNQVEGHIEYIGLHATDIRTLDKKLLSVPNAFFITRGIVNASRMTNRRIQETIRIERVHPDIVDSIIQEIRVMLQNHPGIDQNQILMAHFTEFGEYSININLYAFTRTKDLKTYRNVQQDVFLNVMAIIESKDATLAFPTRILHISK